MFHQVLKNLLTCECELRVCCRKPLRFGALQVKSFMAVKSTVPEVNVIIMNVVGKYCKLLP